VNPRSLPDVSIVIPVYNRGEIIRYTLESVRQAADGLSVEVIVVDDGSDPPAAESIARQLVAEKAFCSWRGLPRGFCPEFGRRELAIWRRLEGPRRFDHFGGKGFLILARLLDPVAAARMLGRLQNGPYQACRTLTDSELVQLMAGLPPAGPDAAAL
jgi:hypothetical protein